MNWTGGRLQRHSRNSAGKSLTYTQKQHFAKVRSKLQTGPRAVSPLDFSLLHASRDAREARELKGDESGLERRPKRQKTLGEYATTAALANRLNALRPRQLSLGRGTSSEIRHGAKRTGHANTDASSRARHNVSVGHRPSIVPDATSRDQSDGVRNPTREVGLRLEPRSSRRKILATTLVGSGSGGTPKSLEDKRQSLLQQDDWVCTAITRPLKASFLGTNDREKVGRRRRISTEERNRRVVPVHRRFRRSLQQGLLPRGFDWEDREVREDISVRIGGQVHGSQRTTLRGIEALLSQSQHHSMSSESMLLDKEDTWYGAQDIEGLSPRTSLLGADSQDGVPEADLWHSVTDSSSSPFLSGSSGARFDGIRRRDEVQSDMHYRVEDEEEQGRNDSSQSDDLYGDTERRQTSRKSSVQTLGHHYRTDIAEDRSTNDVLAKICIEGRDESRGKNGFISNKKCIPLASREPGAEPLRLIFDSTSQATTSQLSDTGATSIHNTQAIRSTIVEASDDTKDAVIKDSDEIEWEKVVMLGRSPKTDAHSKSSFSKADTANKLIDLGLTNKRVVTTPAATTETARKQSDFRLAANGQPLVAPVNEVLIDRNARLQTEDEIWMKFLDICGDAERDQEKEIMVGGLSSRRFESSDEPELPMSHCRPVNESILAQASSQSAVGTIVESPSLCSAQFASDRAHSQTEGPVKQTLSLSPLSPMESMGAIVGTSSAPFTSDSYMSTAATFHTSSPDPLVATTSTAPLIAAAMAHSSCSGSLLPSTSPAAPRSDERPPQQSQVSSPDPLTLKSPSALHEIGHAASMQPSHRQRILFTKPIPFTGRRVSATAIQKASREPLHLGRAIAGSSSRSRSEPKHAKATARTGMRKGREVSGGAGRAAARSIYSIPSTDSDIEDGSVNEHGTESSEDDDLGLLEQI